MTRSCTEVSVPEFVLTAFDEWNRIVYSNVTMDYYNRTSYCDNSTTIVTIQNTVSENIGYRLLIQRIDGTTHPLSPFKTTPQQFSSPSPIPTP